MFLVVAIVIVVVSIILMMKIMLIKFSFEMTFRNKNLSLKSRRGDLFVEKIQRNGSKTVLGCV